MTIISTAKQKRYGEASRKAYIANEKARALFDIITADEEGLHREENGRKAWLEFVSVKGTHWQIGFFTTTSNVILIQPDGQYKVYCAGPDQYAAYVAPDHERTNWVGGEPPAWDHDQMRADYEETGHYQKMPIWDVFLGQYLTLKYNEEEFLAVAR